MIPITLWGWSNTSNTMAIRRQLMTLQTGNKYHMPVIYELPKQTIALISVTMQQQIFEAKGRPNIHVIFLHPSFRTSDLKSISDSFSSIIRAAAFHTKTFVIFCDATGCYPDNGRTVTTPGQVNSTLRHITTQYPLNSLYVDLQQIICTNDWTRHFNLRTAGQVKLGQAIVRAVQGTTGEVFQYG